MRSILLFAIIGLVLVNLSFADIYQISLDSPADGTIRTVVSTTLSFTPYSDTDTTGISCNVTVDGGIAAGISTDNATQGSYTSSFAEGNHTWDVTCGDSANSAISSTQWFLVDLNGPTINESNITPVNNTNSSNLTQTFTFVVTDVASPTLNCSLYLDPTDMTAGTLSQTNETVLNNTPTSFTVGFGSEQYNRSWNVQCFDLRLSSYTSYIRYVNVDTTEPTVNLMSPANNTNTSNTTIDYVFNASDNNIYGVMNCTLHPDAGTSSSNSSTLNDTPTTFSSIVVGEQYHDWYVSCVDPAGNIGNSETFNFTVDETAPVIMFNWPGKQFNVCRLFN